MKTKSLLFFTSVFSLAAMLLLTSAPAEPDKAEPAKKVETREIKVRDGVKLTFSAEVVDDPAERVSTDSGYINYKGKVYTGLFSPPRCILTSGILEIDGKKISLDVSGIANPWVKPEELDAGDVHVDVSPDGKRHGAKSGDKVPGERSGEVAVFFTKGGADDHLVTWAIQGDASLRISIENRDFPAEWQEGYSLVKKIQERIMRQETELKLSVPASGEAGQVPRRPGELVINVSKDGTMEFGGKTVDAKVLKEKLTEIAKIDRKRAIIIRAEKDVPYKEIVSVLDLTHVAGLYHVSFATNTQEKE